MPAEFDSQFYEIVGEASERCSKPGGGTLVDEFHKLCRQRVETSIEFKTATQGIAPELLKRFQKEASANLLTILLGTSFIVEPNQSEIRRELAELSTLCEKLTSKLKYFDEALAVPQNGLFDIIHSLMCELDQKDSSTDVNANAWYAGSALVSDPSKTGSEVLFFLHHTAVIADWGASNYRRQDGRANWKKPKDPEAKLREIARELIAKTNGTLKGKNRTYATVAAFLTAVLKLEEPIEPDRLRSLVRKNG